ncbi:MAG: hypothetical protein HY698_09455 [Deltaproteobacteria bacterium]|nr:hypothetical protein [Deltaproteobacteria bacterium]
MVSIALLVVNDHVLKRVFGNFWTGKLSDLAGLVFFPLLLVAAWELVDRARAPWRGPSRRAVVVSVLTTGMVFSLVKLWLPAKLAYCYGLAALRWPAWALVEFTARGRIPGLEPLVLVQDASDLLVLPALFISWAVGHARAGAE